MLVDYLCGYDADDNEGKEEDWSEISAEQISALIIAGDALGSDFPISSNKSGGGSDFEDEYSLEAQQQRDEIANTLAQRLKELDNWIALLCASLDVYLMPGKHDPSNLLLPQPPIHPCLLPWSHSFDTFHSVSNPFQIEIDAIEFCLFVELFCCY
ncbi:hypothetical protein RFI_04803 [Reticulomyxa filosa]|uniref:DNA polymerase alpha/delta/epsilon subunit B domain-containing protein n=1 Tax=Reticulomyxa filosa TaxID=46433 RepID=X6P2K8_RETFI|nr:hypothetical protein RFI_04803 [Reticulomyxa filosa]|eukprot:ETO32314.1 hypothetical protein RFI_04803 [Reticulomyxa filosa]